MDKVNFPYRSDSHLPFLHVVHDSGSWAKHGLDVNYDYEITSEDSHNNVANGSVYSKGVSSLGSNANHYIQYGLARLFIPVVKKFGVGADGFLFWRKSRYSEPGFENIDQRTPRLRVFLAFNSYR